MASKKTGKQHQARSIKNAKIIVYDFDGVMTDNRILVDEDGREAVFCNRADGLAISQIKKSGILQLILSSEKNKVVICRGRKLGIDVITGVENKKSALIRYCEKKGCNLKNVLYVGNDINDFEAMKAVGITVCPADACVEVKKISKIILEVCGGSGVVRNLLRYIYTV